jgi:uncharacterized protein YkwD
VTLLRRALLVPVLALALMASPLLLAPPAAAGAAANSLLAQINADRKGHGLKPLTMRSDLNRAAGNHNRAMAARGVLSHSNLGRICCFRAAAENVAYGANPAAVHRMLMASPAHRANILNARYDEVGFGAYTRNGVLWVTQIFRDRS